MVTIKLPILTGVVLLLLAITSGCAVNPVTGQSQLMLLSEQGEQEMGRQTDQSVVEEYGVYPSAALQGYIQRVAAPLARVSHRPELPWQFKIMDSPVVNAFAAPGGYVFVTRGLLAAVNDEAELAGVLAHEIGHVTARHSAHQYSQSMLAGLGLELGKSLTGSYGQVLGPLFEAGTGLLFLKYSRDDERQSDTLGVEYATRAGYDTNRMADFFGTLQRQESLDGGGRQVPEWFSSHPGSAERETAVRSLTREWQSRFPGQEFRVNREVYLAQIDGLVYGDDPRRGFREGEWFYLPEEQVQFRIPAQWSFEREGSQAQLLHPQKAGVILFDLREGTANLLAKAFVAKLQAQVQQATEQTVNGMQSLRLISLLVDGKKRARVVSYFIQKGNKVYMFHGIADEAGFSRLAATLEQPATSFSLLTDKAMLNRQPLRIVVKVIGKATTLESALQGYKIDRKLWPRIAWMNELRLADRLQSGQRIKIIE
jgi:predicted Zn-dependent protease